jgi:TPP-dependent 2-oxoacid decarboxylase
VNFPCIDWVGCCNELNAGYAADRHARVHGIAALNTTYGVGELSAINAIAGAYAEHVPVFRLVGMPNRPTQAARGLVHHTLGNREFDFFRKMAEPVVCASATKVYPNVEMKDVLTELARRVTKRNQKRPVQPGSLGPVKGAGSDPITMDALYPRWANFIKPNDILVTETGSSACGLAFALLPKGAKFYNQTLWGAIGYCR